MSIYYNLEYFMKRKDKKEKKEKYILSIRNQ